MDPRSFYKYFYRVLGVSLVIRLLTVFLVRNTPVYQMSDSFDYVRLGNQVAAGNWLTFPDGTRDFTRPPGYPIFLGVIAKLQSMLGLEFLPLRLTAGMAQSVLAVLALGLFGLMIKRRVSGNFGARLALLTTALLAVWPESIIWPAALTTEALSLPLVLIGTSLVLWDRTPRVYPLLAGGAVLGYSVLVRSSNIPVLVMVIVVVMIGQRGKALRNASVLALGAGLVMLPWLGYAHATTGRLIIDTTSGQNWCLASSEHANGSWNPGCNPRPDVNYLQELDRQTSEAHRWAMEHPAQWMMLRLKIASLQLLTGTGSWTNVLDFSKQSMPWIQAMADVATFISWHFAAISGSIAFWRRDGMRVQADGLYWQLGVIAFASLIAPILFFYAPRFSAPLVPFMVLACSFWLLTTRRKLGLKVQQKLPSFSTES